MDTSARVQLSPRYTVGAASGLIETVYGERLPDEFARTVTIGELDGVHTKPRHRDPVLPGTEDLSLLTVDRPTGHWSRFPIRRRQTRDVTAVEVLGAQSGTLARGLVTNRVVNPLRPSYELPGMRTHKHGAAAAAAAAATATGRSASASLDATAASARMAEQLLAASGPGPSAGYSDGGSSAPASPLPEALPPRGDEPRLPTMAEIDALQAHTAAVAAATRAASATSVSSSGRPRERQGLDPVQLPLRMPPKAPVPAFKASPSSRRILDNIQVRAARPGGSSERRSIGSSCVRACAAGGLHCAVGPADCL